MTVLLISLLFVAKVLAQLPLETPPVGAANMEPVDTKFFSHYIVDRNTLLLKRRILLYHDELYAPWSQWGNCSRKDCTEMRFRKCVNDSYEERITDLFRTSSCPFQYIAETRRCQDTSECKQSGLAEDLTKLNETCGLRTYPEGQTTKTFQLKIMGGKQADPHSWPWQVGLYVSLQTKAPGRYPRRSNAPYCGGTLISDNWIVTAAHCLSELVPHKELPVGILFNTDEEIGMQLKARLGDHSRIRKENFERDHFIETAIMHPEYRRGFSENGYDVALLKLSEPVTLGNGVNTICIPSKDITFPEGHKCYSTGWGETYSESTSVFGGQGIWDLIYGMRDFSYPFFQRSHKSPVQPTTLQEVELPLVSLSKCRRFFGNLREGVHVCAGKKGKDTCRGDSGGGLFCEKDGRFQLYGVTSFGSGRGCGKFYGVYTCLRGVADWIHDSISN